MEREGARLVPGQQERPSGGDRGGGVDLDPLGAGHGREGPALEERPAVGIAGVAALLEAVLADQPVGAVSARAGQSRHQLGRWIRGVAEPRLPDLLRAIDGASLRLLDWLSEWVDPADLRSARSAWRSLQGARALARASPWASAVLLALGLADYRALPAHLPGFVAERLGIPVDLEQGSLDVLVAAGLVRRDGERLVPLERPPVDVRGTEPRNLRTGGDPAAVVDPSAVVARPAAREWRADPNFVDRGPRTDLEASWSRVALDRLDAGAPGLHTWNLFSVDAGAEARIEGRRTGWCWRCSTWCRCRDRGGRHDRPRVRLRAASRSSSGGLAVHLRWPGRGGESR